jgi:hypothetical protein
LQRLIVTLGRLIVDFGPEVVDLDRAASISTEIRHFASIGRHARSTSPHFVSTDRRVRQDVVVFDRVNAGFGRSIATFRRFILDLDD